MQTILFKGSLGMNELTLSRLQKSPLRSVSSGPLILLTIILELCINSPNICRICIVWVPVNIILQMFLKKTLITICFSLNISHAMFGCYRYEWVNPILPVTPKYQDHFDDIFLIKGFLHYLKEKC